MVFVLLFLMLLNEFNNTRNNKAMLYIMYLLLNKSIYQNQFNLMFNAFNVYYNINDKFNMFLLKVDC